MAKPSGGICYFIPNGSQTVNCKCKRSMSVVNLPKILRRY